MTTWAAPGQLSLLEDPIDARFRAFIHENPHVVTRVIALAREWKTAGHDRCSMELIFARLRWDEGIATATTDGLRLNDHFTSRMSRHVMNICPDLDGLFSTRTLRGDTQ